MGSRKTTTQRETTAAEATSAGPTGADPAGRPTVEERRERILSSISKLDDDGILRVDWFVRGILEDDPVLKSMASAPVEDESLTEEEEQALEESRKEMESGQFLTHEEVRRLWLGDRA